jgi:hypothetical protein
MTPTDKSKFIKQLVGLAAIKPGKDLTPEAYEIWWQAMQSWSMEDFTAAAAQLARSVEFMPSPYHFEQLRKAGRPTAGEAWASVLRYVRSDYSPSGLSIVNGGDTKPKSELIDRAVAALGGYRTIALSSTENTQFLERRFCEHYATIEDATDVRKAVPQIAQDRRLLT